MCVCALVCVCECVCVRMCMSVRSCACACACVGGGRGGARVRITNEILPPCFRHVENAISESAFLLNFYYGRKKEAKKMEIGKR